jgi:outer membrane protein TolC
MKEYNALIGVQVAAYYPTITLSGSYGFSASNLGSLFSTANSVWDYGASLSETLLDFGARRARVKVAKAQFDEQVAAYRETVLTAFQGVEDELVALRVYQGEEAVVNEAAAQARKATELYLNQYKAGTVDYTTVISAETTAFSDELQVAALLEERQIASVTLIEDLGGGWSVEDLPKQK